MNDMELDLLLADILKVYNYNFKDYCRIYLKRRLNRRQALNGINSFGGLKNQILNNEVFFKTIFEDININVTEMFRNPMFFRALREEVLPKLAKRPLIKLWLAGCATGEEVISIAILLKEMDLLEKTIIYATDVNNAGLNTAQQAIYPIHKIRKYSENYIQSGGMYELSKYYTAGYQHVKFNADLLKSVKFAHHNLAMDAPFSKFHMIICRNVLIYFESTLQARIFALFNHSLHSNGYMALGHNETIDFWEGATQYNKTITNKIWMKKRACAATS